MHHRFCEMEMDGGSVIVGEYFEVESLCSIMMIMYLVRSNPAVQL